MGLDAEGYFVTKRSLSDNEIAQVLEDWKDMHRIDIPFSFCSLRGRPEFTDRCIEIRFDLLRLYSPDYARGPFFQIWAVLGWLKRRTYVEAVYYGSDSVDLVEISEYNDEREREMSDHWLKHGWNTYGEKPRKRFS